MLFLSGATGALGRQVLDFVLAEVPASKVRAMARNPAVLAPFAQRGVEVVKADFDDAESLRVALKGIHSALLISGNVPGKRVAQHQTFLDAACKNAVARLTYTSLLRADVSELKIAEDHWATEEAIRHAGIPATILRNGWYFENFTDHLAQMLADGGMPGAAKEGRVHAASRRDYAQATANVLLAKCGVGGIHELAGDEGFTLAELVDEVERQAKKPLRYTAVSPAELEQGYLAAGLPPFVASLLTDVHHGIARGDLADETQDLRKLLGRPTMTLPQAVAAGLARLAP